MVPSDGHACEAPAGPATRRGQHLKNVRTTLETWRFKLQSRNYAHSLFTPAILLPNPTLTTLASNARIKTLNDMTTLLNPLWFLATRHGQEVIDLLAKLDADEKNSREHEKLERREAKKQETVRLREAKRLQTTHEWSQARNSMPSCILNGSSTFNTPSEQVCHPLEHILSLLTNMTRWGCQLVFQHQHAYKRVSQHLIHRQARQHPCIYLLRFQCSIPWIHGYIFNTQICSCAYQVCFGYRHIHITLPVTLHHFHRLPQVPATFHIHIIIRIRRRRPTLLHLAHIQRPNTLSITLPHHITILLYDEPLLMTSCLLLHGTTIHHLS